MKAFEHGMLSAEAVARVIVQARDDLDNDGAASDASRRKEVDRDISAAVAAIPPLDELIMGLGATSGKGAKAHQGEGS